jgi:NhaP-type Na+/H+ or K+/H+ antiporter
MGCLEWSLVYLGATLAGALIPCFYVIYSIRNDADQGSPGGLLILLAIVSVVGACGGLILAGLGHLLLRITRRSRN